jgi:hypothetical protein
MRSCEATSPPSVTEVEAALVYVTTLTKRGYQPAVRQRQGGLKG